MKAEKTGRGFEIIKFKDRYGKECSLQQSSLADFDPPGSTAVWLGRDDSDRMHLDRKLVGELVKYLNQWLKDYTFVV